MYTTLHHTLYYTFTAQGILHCILHRTMRSILHFYYTVYYIGLHYLIHFYFTWGEQLLGPRKLCDRDLTVVLCDAINNF